MYFGHFCESFPLFGIGNVCIFYQRMFSQIIANSADSDQTAPKEQSDLGLNYLLKLFVQVFPN